MDQGLRAENHAESSSTPHPQPHELEDVAAVNEHHEDGPQEPLSVPSQPGPHGSGAGDHEEISGMNKQEQLLAATPQAQAHSFGAGDLFEHDGIPKVNEQEQLLQQSEHDSPGANGGAQKESQAPRQDELIEDLATVPITKLQQLVELCAQILRESRGSKSVEPDIEKDGEARSFATPSKLANASDDTQNIFYPGFYLDRLPATYESNRVAIEEIWSNVSPWPIQQVPLASPEELQLHPILALSTPEVLHQLLFTVFPGSSPERTKIEACIPSFRMKYTRRRCEAEKRKRNLMIACFCEIDVENTQIGSILEYCYKYGVLEQPIEKGSRAYLDQICLLVECWSLLNRVSEISLIFEDVVCEEGKYMDSSHRLEMILIRRKSLEEILGLGFVDLLRILHLLNPVPPPLDSSPGPTLRLDDLDVLSLSTLGKLSINWTSILENHMYLDLEKMSLSIAWSLLPCDEFMTMKGLQNSVIDRIPMSFIGGDINGDKGTGSFDLDKEVAQSWAFLFATSKNIKSRFQHYDEWLKSNEPKWYVDDTSVKCLRLRHLGALTEDDDGDETPDIYLCYLMDHYRRVSRAALNKDPVSYAQFPVFETRLRQLRHYMDSQKPRGLRQLWKDNRDSLNYYTFWGVIIFGLLSVFFALFSLAVSVAQTVASFRALELATPPAPTN